MKFFRNIIYVLLFITGLPIAGAVIGGCKNKCGSTTCQNGGDCESNVCVCPIGYSGNSCQNSWSASAIGTYTCTNANCTPVTVGPASWESVISADATNGGYTIDITNFNGSNETVVATIDSSIHGISSIAISSSSGVNATGTFDSAATSRVNLHFTEYTAGSSSYTCNMVMTKLQ